MCDQLRQLIKLLGEDDVFDGRAMMVKGYNAPTIPYDPELESGLI